MKLRYPALCLSVLAAMSATSGTALAKPVKDQVYKITILHTNDHHGRFWRNSDGEYGMAARKNVIEQIRADVRKNGGYSLLLDGGDVNTGVPESDMQDAEPDFKGMNLLGYDAMAVGNHEFDKSPEVLAKQRQWINFPMLSANIYKDGKRLFEPYRIFKLGDVRVAVMGLTTDDTKKLTNPENTKGIEFRKPAREAAKLVPQLRKQADVVIATTHMGHYDDGNHGVNAPGDVEMARAVKGLDLIVGGHSQSPVCMKAENVRDTAYVPGTDCAPDRQNGAWIVQAHEWGKYVGRADFEFRNGEFKLVKYQLIPINLKKTVKGADGKEQKVYYTQQVHEHSEVLNFLKPYQEKGQEALSVEIGATEGKLVGDRNQVRSQPTSMGILIASAMKEKAQADFAIMNSGGVRDSIAAGKITYKDVLKVQPFGNTLVYVDMNGKEALELLRTAAKMSPGSGAFPQFAGVKLVIEGGDVKQAQIGGKDIDPAKTYRVALNNFTAAGGDGYPKLSTHKGYVNTGYADADVLKAFISARGGVIKAGAFDPAGEIVRK
ncbi:bifunctional UDP-sugar hydrolase/5'-nucleotidase UshA [Vogesella urethralis]|uniref:bifunctional UDP-sugar hydrolase/5'-nucleotidase UshA n=1 Tax=Vogesella urethralis TaxID=2592656 RepID=UPI0011853764|nr:bifunctional UDP-sugar hydrolase/5'-nucleotidase UshA [Vogesella urethralis]